MHGQDLYGDVALESGVSGTVHLAHAARTKDVRDQIRAETDT